MKNFSFYKDKSSIKYYLIAFVCVLCVYSSFLINLLKPLFDKIYYGNISQVLVNSFTLLLWGIEFVSLCLVCKKLNINIFTDKENKNKELSLKRLIILYIIAIIPMIVISFYLNFTLKIVYELGVKVTVWGFVQNAINMASWILRIAFITVFINSIHLALEKNIKFNNDNLNKYFPYGAILSFLIFGLIDFFLISTSLRLFYLIVSFLYGIVYLLSDKKFSTTFVVSYLIWLL